MGSLLLFSFWIFSMLIEFPTRGSKLKNETTTSPIYLKNNFFNQGLSDDDDYEGSGLSVKVNETYFSARNSGIFNSAHGLVDEFHTQLLSSAYSDEVESSGSESIQVIKPRTFKSLIYDHGISDKKLCMLNLGQADFLFVLNIEASAFFTGNWMQHCIQNIVGNLDMTGLPIRTAILTMGSSGENVSEVLSLENGTSHRAVQESLQKIKNGRGIFKVGTVLNKLQKMLNSSRNGPTIVILLSTKPLNDGRNSRLVNSIKKSFPNSIFYNLFFDSNLPANRMTDSPVQGSNLFTILHSQTTFVAQTHELFALLVKQFGCNNCLPNPCPLGTVCLPNNKGYTCECPPSHISGNCDPCLSNPCLESKCLVSGISFICDPCDPSPCGGGGTCLNINGTSSCLCGSNFVGKYCEIPCPYCKNEGKCRLRNGTAVCECAKSFIGTQCDFHCSNFITCLNGGICDFDEGTAICRCVAPYTGRQCENSCSTTSCKNGGTCVNVNGKVICFCLPRFKGYSCEIDLCDSYFKCENGGTCHFNNLTHRVECACPAPFSGADCSFGPCDGISCDNNGTCKLDNRRPTCVCPPPFKGETCKDDFCTINPCLNGGTCLLTDDSYKCSCSYGYWGRVCSFNPCEPNLCENGMKCVPIPVGNEFIYKCICPNGFDGNNCSDPTPIMIAATSEATSTDAALSTNDVSTITSATNATAAIVASTSNFTTATIGNYTFTTAAATSDFASTTVTVARNLISTMVLTSSLSYRTADSTSSSNVTSMTAVATSDFASAATTAVTNDAASVPAFATTAMTSDAAFNMTASVTTDAVSVTTASATSVTSDAAFSASATAAAVTSDAVSVASASAMPAAMTSDAVSVATASAMPAAMTSDDVSVTTASATTDVTSDAFSISAATAAAVTSDADSVTTALATPAAMTSDADSVKTASATTDVTSDAFSVSATTMTSDADSVTTASAATVMTSDDTFSARTATAAASTTAIATAIAKTVTSDATSTASTAIVAVTSDATVSTSAAAVNNVCKPNPCASPCLCYPSCKHENGYTCVSSNGKLGKNCSIAPPTLHCSTEIISVTIDNQLLLELSNGIAGFGYFELTLNENTNVSEECKSIPDSSGTMHILNLIPPFTSCGTTSYLNENRQIVISGNVFFNVETNSMYDMPVPVLAWCCNFSTEYSVKTSIKPILDQVPKVDLKLVDKHFVPAQFELCKSTLQCIRSCPEHLLVQPGGVYTVGQSINIILKTNAIFNTMLHLMDFYISCGRTDDFQPVVSLISDGCPTRQIPSELSTKSTSICLKFPLPRLYDCNVVYFHAKLQHCSRLEACEESTLRRCVSTGRYKRSIERVESFGPIYILQSSLDDFDTEKANIPDLETTQELQEQDFFSSDINVFVLIVFVFCIALLIGLSIALLKSKRVF